MKHNKTNEKGRAPGLYPVSVAQRQEEKGPREKSDITREDKERHHSNSEDAWSGGGQNNPTAAPGRTGSIERERRGSRASLAATKVYKATFTRGLKHPKLNFLPTYSES